MPNTVLALLLPSLIAGSSPGATASGLSREVLLHKVAAAHARLLAHPSCLLLTLRPLDPEETGRLLSHTLGGLELPAEAAELVRCVSASLPLSRAAWRPTSRLCPAFASPSKPVDSAAANPRHLPPCPLCTRTMANGRPTAARLLPHSPPGLGEEQWAACVL